MACINLSELKIVCLLSDPRWPVIKPKSRFFRSQLANSLVPSEIKPGISLATVSAVLHSKDNKHTLQVCHMTVLIWTSLLNLLSF